MSLLNVVCTKKTAQPGGAAGVYSFIGGAVAGGVPVAVGSRRTARTAVHVQPGQDIVIICFS